MKKIFLTRKKNYYKANLHCHSTVSDGEKTPEELKEMYMEQGYSIIAYTDHNVFILHNELTDDKFLAMNGFELDIYDREHWTPYIKNCHICYVALDPTNETQICYHRNNEYQFRNTINYTQYVKFDESKPDFKRIYSPECINEMIAEGRKNGFFVTYNHPGWSLETASDYNKYNGMNAMEICNYGALRAGFTDYNEKDYDNMLCDGKKIFCIAADDNHNHPHNRDSFGGFTVINAERLDYPTIANALLNGDFYASQGPEIYELWYEDGKIGIECSDAYSVVLNTGVRRAAAVYADEIGKPVTRAEFDINFEWDRYARLTVTDASGKKANTNAFFIEDLIK